MGQRQGAGQLRIEIGVPDIREVRLIADCQKALEGKAEVFHSTVKAWQEGLKANIQPDWPLVKGEMRHPYTKGSTSGCKGPEWVARPWTKSLAIWPKSTMDWRK